MINEKFDIIATITQTEEMLWFEWQILLFKTAKDMLDIGAVKQVVELYKESCFPQGGEKVSRGYRRDTS